VKLAQFKTKDSKQRLGLAVDDVVCDVAELARVLAGAGTAPASWLLEAGDMLDVIGRGESALGEISALLNGGQARHAGGQVVGYSIDEIEFLPAVRPSKILAIGRNYVDHAIEGGAEPPSKPLLFNKLPNSLSAHNAPIALSNLSQKVDYEAELAVVIGRRARQVSEANALEHVFGYTLINDVSARDLQFGDGQWTRGKGLDTFAPLGPFITTRDEIADSEAQIARGTPAERPFILVGQQSLFDPLRAPAGKHTVWAYCHIPNGSTFDMTDRVEAQIERFAPGFRDRVLARSVMSPAEVYRHNENNIGGDIGGGANTLLQFMTRPFPKVDPYATSARDVYLCSASTPPGGGVHGMCGYHAARSATRRVFA